MDERLQVHLHEYTQLKESERASRDLLYKINSFAAITTSGLFVAIMTYNIHILALAGPLIFYLLGYQCSFELLRLLRISHFIRETEREVRGILAQSGKPMAAGFQDQERYRGLVVSCALLYLVFYLAFYYLLAQSPYSRGLKTGAVIFYILLGGVLWGYDLWTNRKYLFPKKNVLFAAKALPK